MLSTHEASEYLVRSGVPPEVIARVLFQPGLRRAMGTAAA
jgi:hypothetical protein